MIKSFCELRFSLVGLGNNFPDISILLAVINSITLIVLLSPLHSNLAMLILFTLV